MARPKIHVRVYIEARALAALIIPSAPVKSLGQGRVNFTPEAGYRRRGRLRARNNAAEEGAIAPGARISCKHGAAAPPRRLLIPGPALLHGLTRPRGRPSPELDFNYFTSPRETAPRIYRGTRTGCTGVRLGLRGFPACETVPTTACSYALQNCALLLRPFWR